MRRLFVCFVVLAALASPAVAQAATITVTTNAPEAASSGECGLFDAVDAAVTLSKVKGCGPGQASNTINFASSVRGTIVLDKLLPAISNDLEIIGPGADQLTISGNNAFRVLEVSTGNLALSEITLAEGFNEESGAGLQVKEAGTAELTRVTVRDNEVKASGAFAEGAGILNQGNLTVTESTITGNTAFNNTPSGGTLENKVEANGAGIASSGIEGDIGGLVVDRSTVSGNHALVEGATGNLNVRGGGVFVFELSTLAIRNSTISGNEVKLTGAAGNQVGGGGVFVWPATPEATIQSSTIAGNLAPAGANVFAAGATELRNTLVARPLGSGSCTGTIVSQGFNLDESTSCGFNKTGDQSGVNPGLAPTLAANGGPTQTLALLNGSPAVDKGVVTGEGVDQRGLKRPVEIPGVPNAAFPGDGADIGAFEVQAPPRAAILRGPRDGETIEDAQPIFEFAADAASNGFVCSIDGAAPFSCASPYKTPVLANGTHTFTVSALGESFYAGEAASRTFKVDVKTTPPPTKAAPKAKINNLPSKTTKRRLKIRFSATEKGSTFQCKLDGKKWRRCKSPWTTPKLSLGKHVFKLKATGTTGLTGKATTKKFRVVAPPPPK